jgi:hypothetical protein
VPEVLYPGAADPRRMAICGTNGDVDVRECRWRWQKCGKAMLSSGMGAELQPTAGPWDGPRELAALVSVPFFLYVSFGRSHRYKC